MHNLCTNTQRRHFFHYLLFWLRCILLLFFQERGQWCGDGRGRGGGGGGAENETAETETKRNRDEKTRERERERGGGGVGGRDRETGGRGVSFISVSNAINKDIEKHQ